MFNGTVRNTFLRFFLYCTGFLVLAIGITLNTKTALGVSPIISVAYCISQVGGWNFGDITFLLYFTLILTEILLHLIKRTVDQKRKILSDVLQLPVSLLFTRFLNLFATVIPVFDAVYSDSFFGSFLGRFLLLICAILLTGVGAFLTLFVHMVPNPGDGFVHAIADFTKIPIGMAKNLVDINCVILSIAISAISSRQIIGIGIGTLVTMFGVGRVIAFCEYFLSNVCHVNGKRDVPI